MKTAQNRTPHTAYVHAYDDTGTLNQEGAVCEGIVQSEWRQQLAHEAVAVCRLPPFARMMDAVRLRFHSLRREGFIDVERRLVTRAARRGG